MRGQPMGAAHFAWRHAMDAPATRTAAGKENDAGDKARVAAKGATRALGARVAENEARTPLKRPLGALPAEGTPLAVRTPLAARSVPNGSVSSVRRPLGALPTSSLVSPAASALSTVHASDTTPKRSQKSPRAAARQAMLAEISGSDALAVAARPRAPRAAGHSMLRAVVTLEELYTLPVDTCTSADLRQTWSVEEAAGLVLPRIEDICVTDKGDECSLHVQMSAQAQCGDSLATDMGRACAPNSPPSDVHSDPPCLDISEDVPLSAALCD